MDFHWLSQPLEHLDESLAGGLDGAGLALIVVVAALLGLRHAFDPDHLAAVTAMASTDRRRPRAAMRLGAWWGVGHAVTLVAVGVPLILLGTNMPSGIESAAEKAVGALIVLLTGRMLWRWARREHRAIARGHAEAAGIGVVHGLGGTGAVVVTLLASGMSPAAALVGLGVFAPMSVASMAACTGAYAWVAARPAARPLYFAAWIPVLGAFNVLFGLWYLGVLG